MRMLGCGGLGTILGLRVLIGVSNRLHVRHTFDILVALSALIGLLLRLRHDSSLRMNAARGEFLRSGCNPRPERSGQMAAAYVELLKWPESRRITRESSRRLCHWVASWEGRQQLYVRSSEPYANEDAVRLLGEVPHCVCERRSHLPALGFRNSSSAPVTARRLSVVETRSRNFKADALEENPLQMPVATLSEIAWPAEPRRFA